MAPTFTIQPSVAAFLAHCLNPGSASFPPIFHSDGSDGPLQTPDFQRQDEKDCNETRIRQDKRR